MIFHFSIQLWNNNRIDLLGHKNSNFFNTRSYSKRRGANLAPLLFDKKKQHLFFHYFFNQITLICINTDKVNAGSQGLNINTHRLIIGENDVGIDQLTHYVYQFYGIHL